MKYILLCGGKYTNWETPRQLTQLGPERLIERTIRLLRECGVEDIAISTNHPAFDELGVEIIHHSNPFVSDGDNPIAGHWVDAFPLRSEPTCYIFGDVVFSKRAIQTIVETETDDIEFFASAPPFALNYFKRYAEPFAFKVTETKHFRSAIAEVKRKISKFDREPIAWELWQVIKGTEYNVIDYDNYIKINDYTCDIDKPEDALRYHF
jgi:hypothetical protein